ncbi:hypothetical protein DL96DRAFT_1703611 [Flagelloscypha sp. PMI_526]|nr:hypothetical protein DL96DRAFT_1703611 [Flagelloscypha sp. PMI_526]
MKLLEVWERVWLRPDGNMQVVGEGSRCTFPGSGSAQYLHHWFSTHANSHLGHNKMPSNSLPNPFEDFPPPADPYLPSFEEATAIGGGTLRLPNYRASYIRRYHPYIRWTAAPPRIVYFTVNPRLTIAELVHARQQEGTARAASPLGTGTLGVVKTQLQIIVKDTNDGLGELEPHNEDGK